MTQPKNPDLQGEGNYDASRRHRKSVEAFVEGGRVEPAAEAAAPKNEAEAQEMKQAEDVGKQKARR